ncbi:MAG: hypothetical protein ABWY08_07640, partial [Comamonas sp.]
ERIQIITQLRTRDSVESKMAALRQPVHGSGSMPSPSRLERLERLERLRILVPSVKSVIDMDLRKISALSGNIAAGFEKIIDSSALAELDKLRPSYFNPKQAVVFPGAVSTGSEKIDSSEVEQVLKKNNGVENPTVDASPKSIEHALAQANDIKTELMLEDLKKLDSRTPENSPLAAYLANRR